MKAKERRTRGMCWVLPTLGGGVFEGYVYTSMSGVKVSGFYNLMWERLWGCCYGDMNQLQSVKTRNV